MTYTSVDELAYGAFGNFFYKNKESFQELKVKIRHSHIPMSVDQYLALAFMCSVFAGISGGAFGLWLGLKTFGDPYTRLSLFVDSTRAGFAEEYLYLLAILVALLLFFISFLIIFGVAYIYPYLQADIRNACIDKSMLPAVTYMYALTKGGMSIYDVFRSLSMYTHIFGTSAEEEEKRDKKIKLYRQLYNIRDLVFNPYRTIRDEPRYTFFFGIPLGFYYLAHLPEALRKSINFNLRLNPNFTHFSDNSVHFISAIDDYLVIFIVIALIPFIIFYEIRAWRMRKIDQRMPEMLRNLSSMNDSGLLLSNSLKIMAESKMGILSKELKKLKEDLSWGTSTSRALMKLENNIRTASSSRILHTLVKANESTSDLKSVLSITAQQVKSEDRLKEERSSEMVVYVVTIYVAFFVFLFIVYILAVHFFPQSASFTNSSQGVGFGGIGNGYFNIEEYTMLMFHSALVQAFTSGLIAGKMGQGSVYMGLKYSVSMMIITYAVFTMFV